MSAGDASPVDTHVGDLSVDPNIAIGRFRTCARRDDGSVRCWGFNAQGQLGYGNTQSIGDDETPASAGNVMLGSTTDILEAGEEHTCVIGAGRVRCWGIGAFGRLGYGNVLSIGDDEVPAPAGEVDVGGVATKIALGSDHTCAVLDSGGVRCWGEGTAGQLGYASTMHVGDNETPASMGDVPSSASVVNVTAGGSHTCTLDESGSVRCWGNGSAGQLGYADTTSIGDDEPASVAGVVDLGGQAVSISAGLAHTCALLTTGRVRCWGAASRGQLGYANQTLIGDDETPASAGDVELGGTALQISAGYEHTCALLVGGHVRCWGDSAEGRLGYANLTVIGDDETPASAGDVDVGGRVVGVVAGYTHTCARLDTGTIRCWGFNAYGQLGYVRTDSIGDDETPASAGDVPFE